MTQQIASAAGQDAANRRMRAAGRTKWNRADYNVAVRTMREILDELPDGKRCPDCGCDSCVCE